MDEIVEMAVHVMAKGKYMYKGKDMSTLIAYNSG